MAEVNDRFRAYRKCIRQVIGSKLAIARFHTLQTVEARRFLLRILDDSNKLEEHIRTEAGAIILKLCYGYTVEPKGSDPLIELADRAMSQSSVAMTPGRWLVDIIPSCKSIWLAKEFNICKGHFSEIFARVVARNEIQEACKAMETNAHRIYGETVCFY